MELKFKMNKPVGFIFDYLTDMQKFVFVHPVISQIDALENNNYLVHETLKFGFIPFSFTYPVNIESNYENKKIIIRATVMRLTKIEMAFEIRNEGDISIVEENIRFKSYLPVKSMMQRIFREQHTQLFKNIEQL